MNSNNIFDFVTRLPFAIAGALAFLPYFFSADIPYLGEPAPVPEFIKSFVDWSLSIPSDISDTLIYLAYPGDDKIWYRNYLNAGLATVLMYARAVLAESAIRGVKLTGVIFMAPFAFLAWPLFIVMMWREYWSFRAEANRRGETITVVPYLIFFEAPFYAVVFTAATSILGVYFFPDS